MSGILLQGAETTEVLLVRFFHPYQLPFHRSVFASANRFPHRCDPTFLESFSNGTRPKCGALTIHYTVKQALRPCSVTTGSIRRYYCARKDAGSTEGVLSIQN